MRRSSSGRVRRDALDARRFILFKLQFNLSFVLLRFRFAPTKFALLFTLGSLFTLSSFMILRGPERFIRHFTEDRNRKTIIISYAVSLVGTLYFSLIEKSYFFSLVAVIVQFVSLTYFLFSYIPGGKQFLNYVFGTIGNCCCPKMWNATGLNTMS